MSLPFTIGAKSSLSNKVTSADITTFADITGDTNPLHLDHEYASQTRFGKCIAHGILGAGLISAVLGTLLPGPGTIYLSQELKFLHPVFSGDTITAEVEIISIKVEKAILTIDTNCFNQDDTQVMGGRAVVKYEPVEGAV